MSACLSIIRAEASVSWVFTYVTWVSVDERTFPLFCANVLQSSISFSLI